MDPGPRIQVLLIEDNDEYAVVVSRSLARPGNAPCEVGRVASLEEALARLGEQRFDVILLDLSLPDSQGIEGINRLRIYCPEVPVVVLTASDSETLGVESVRTGAQDYLVKGQADGRLLSRAIRYAMARNQLQDVLRSLALREELTGLYNRRGFVTLAEQHLKLARRTGRAARLVFVDVNGFKRVNDRFGHPEGDRALVAVAEVLRATFRESDIVARVGGDEFAVLAIEAADASAERLRARLSSNLQAHNAQARRGYDLTVTAGIATFDPQRPAGVDALMAEADRSLYDLKRLRQQDRPGGA